MEISFYAVSFRTCETKNSSNSNHQNKPLDTISTDLAYMIIICVHDCVTSLTFLPSRGATNVHNSGNDHRSIVSIYKPLLPPAKASIRLGASICSHKITRLLLNRFSWNFAYFRKSVENVRVAFKSDKNNGYAT